MTREAIRTWGGIIIGFLDTESNGDVTAREWSGAILGFYKKSRNQTTDFFGRILYTGNCTSALIIAKYKGFTI